MSRIKIGWASRSWTTAPICRLWGKGFGASVYDNQVTPEAGQITVEETVKTLHKL